MPFNKIDSFPKFFIPKSKKEERNMMDKKSWLLVILVIVGLTACATTQSGMREPPLPNDINIIPPSPDLPKEIAGFSGKWRGTWSYGADAILVVEEIHDTWAKVVYSQGDVPRYNVAARFWRFRCKTIPGPKPKLEWTPPGGRPVNFEMRDSNTLEGTQDVVSGDWRGTSTVSMKRTN
jgi:hypothetical protein